MRTSLANGLIVLVCIATLGSGCTTLRRWFGLSKPTPPASSQVPPELVTTPPEGLLTDAEKATAESGEPFDKTRTVDASATFAPVHFAYDSFVIPPPEISKIEQVGQFLLENGTHVVAVEGNCDERGSNEYNLSLGEQRAQAVRKFLIDSGVDANRIQTRSFGEEKPVDPGHNEAAWAKNRRGEFVVYK